jgi:putative permease
MIDIIKGWFEKHFSDPQAIILITILVLGGILVLYWGHILTPVLAGVVIAYVLEGLVKKITQLGVPRFISFLISYTLFITALALILFGLVPLVISQLSQLVVDFPRILNKVQQLILTIPDKYPVFADQEIEKMLGSFSSELVGVGQKLVSVSLASAVDAFTVLVYLVVVPLLVFFILKDKVVIINWFRRFLPEDRGLAYSVWKEVM